MAAHSFSPVFEQVNSASLVKIRAIFSVNLHRFMLNVEEILKLGETGTLEAGEVTRLPHRNGELDAG